MASGDSSSPFTQNIISTMLAALGPPSWWDIDQESTVKRARRRNYRNRFRSVQDSPSLMRRADLERIRSAYLKAQTCEVCTTGRLGSYTDAVKPLDIYKSAVNASCAGCLVLCGILHAYASVADQDEASAWRLSYPFDVKGHGASIKFHNGFMLNVFALGSMLDRVNQAFIC